MKYLLNASCKCLNYSTQMAKYSSQTKLLCQSLMPKVNNQKQTLDNAEASFEYNQNNFLFQTLNNLNQLQNQLNTSSTTPKSTSSSSSNKDPYKKASLEQLLILKDKLVHHLPKFLHETHPYALYAPDVVFENFYKEPGKTTVGALQYAIQLTMLRLKCHWRFSHSRLEVLKITHDESDSTIKVRWRIVGIRGMKSMIQPWKIKAWKVKDAVKSEAEWHDGFSILYVRGDGLIYKHRLERVMSQKEEEAVKTTSEKKLKLENLDIGQSMCTNQSTN